MANERRISKQLLDELLAGEDPTTVFKSDGLLGDLKKALAERILDAPLPAPAAALMTQLLDVIVWRVLRCLERDGLLIRDPEQPWLDLAARDALDGYCQVNRDCTIIAE